MGDRFALTFGNEDQVYRQIDDGIGLQLDERAVPDERGIERGESVLVECGDLAEVALGPSDTESNCLGQTAHPHLLDRKSTRLNSSHLVISYAVFCLKKKMQDTQV